MNLSEIKIAIVHDWLVAPGGAEQVLSRLIKLFPHADLYAVIDDFPEALRREMLHGKIARTTFIQRFPFASRFYRAYLPWMPRAVEAFDLSDYDLVISSSHAVAKGVVIHPHQHHICYCHTPMRYIWDRRFEYLAQLPSVPGIRWLVDQQMEKLRAWDQRTATSVDCFVANSHYIARRIKLAYRRSAQVIYPPVAIENWHPKSTIEKEDYYVTWGRLVKQKHIHLIVEAFSRYLPDKRLLVIGDGPLYNTLLRQKGPRVELLGHLPTSALIQRVQKARAYVHAAVDDFGIAPVEALAAGTPVIAYAQGGVRETMARVSGIGKLYNQRSPEAIASAVKSFEQDHGSCAVQKCIDAVKIYSPGHFDKAMLSLITQRLEDMSSYV